MPNGTGSVAGLEATLSLGAVSRARDLLLRVATQRSDRLFNTIRRDRGTPEKGTETGYRHAIPVLGPIESCRRARSSGVECDKTAHMNRTIAAAKKTVHVSAARMADSPPSVPQLLHRGRAASEAALRPAGHMLKTPACPSTCRAAPAVVVVAHRQRVPKSHITMSGPVGIRKPDVAPVTPSTR